MPGAHVQPPGIKVQVLVALGGGEGAVEADDVEIPILNPDAAQEAACAGVRLGGHIDDDAAQIAEEFAALVIEAVVLAIQSAHIHRHHPVEAAGDELGAEVLVTPCMTRERKPGSGWNECLPGSS